MIPQSEEDKIKSNIARELNRDSQIKNFKEYFIKYQEKYNEARFSKPKSKFWFFKSFTLDEVLFNLACEYETAPEDKKRSIDEKTLKYIKRCSVCKKSPAVVRHYFRIYKDIKRAYRDFLMGHSYIEDREEPVEEGYFNIDNLEPKS